MTPLRYGTHFLVEQIASSDPYEKAGATYVDAGPNSHDVRGIRLVGEVPDLLVAVAPDTRRTRIFWRGRQVHRVVSVVLSARGDPSVIVVDLTPPMDDMHRSVNDLEEATLAVASMRAAGYLVEAYVRQRIETPDGARRFQAV